MDWRGPRGLALQPLQGWRLYRQSTQGRPALRANPGLKA